MTTTTPTSGAADLRATFSEMLVDLPNTEPFTLFKAGFDAALAAGQATAAQQGVAYAALPEPYCNAHDDADACYPDMFSEQQMRAFADATCALRASHGQAPARAQADSVQEDAALWHWLAEYLVGTRTDLDDEIVASETVNDLRKLVKAAIKQGEKQ